MAACDSTTAIAVIRDVATSLSITASGGTGTSHEQLVLELGDTITLSAMAANPLGLAVPAGQVTWSSTDTSVAKVDASGLVSAVGIGTTDIRATAGDAASSLPAVVNDSASF
jgi:uncharacterized protein YjdB